jgi:hypothetical protein
MLKDVGHTLAKSSRPASDLKTNLNSGDCKNREFIFYYSSEKEWL